MEYDAAVTAGTIVPQGPAPFNNATFIGSYQGGSLQAVLSRVTVEADSGSADGNGNLTLFFDTSGPGGPQQGLTSAITYNVDSKGADFHSLPTAIPSGSPTLWFQVGPGYAIAGKVVVLTANSNPTINYRRPTAATLKSTGSALRHFLPVV